MTTRSLIRVSLLGAIGLVCGKKMKKTIYAALSLMATALLATTGVAQTTYDIGTVSTVTFNAGDSLTNTGGITDWDSATQLAFTEGSDFTGVDFTALGLTSWSFSTVAGTDEVINWSGANFSGLSVTLAGANNQLRNDTFVGTDFSNAIINSAGNQPWVTASGGPMDLSNVNFSGATFNLGAGNTVGFAVYVDGTTGNLSGADFTDTTWNYTGGGNAASFNMGPGSTSIADMALAADFSGADFSGLAAMTNVIANLGLFDGATAIGAKYDANTVLPDGFTTADLDAAGWQNVSSFLLGDVNRNGVVDFLDIGPFIGVLSSNQFQLEADINEDGVVDFIDIGPFIGVLSSS